MARKIIKGALFILLALVVAGGIMTYLRSKKDMAPPKVTLEPAVPAVPKSSLQEIVIKPLGESARVELKGITTKSYRVENLESGNGFTLHIPQTQVAQIQKLIDKPHPLIESIQVREPTGDSQMAEVEFKTAPHVNFLDTQQMDTLSIDFVKDEEAAKMAAPTPEPAKKATAAAKKPTTSKSKKTSAAKKPSAKSTKSKSVASKSKSKAAAPIEEPQLDPAFAGEFDSSAFEPTDSGSGANVDSGLGSLGSSGSATDSSPLPQDSGFSDPDFPTVDSKPAEIAKDPDANDGFNLNKLAETNEPTSLLDAETELSMKDDLGKKPDQIAAIPKDEKFDLNQVKANLPALKNLTVQANGAASVVTFAREKSMPYKFFKMVNPSRIVIEFKDAKNQLQPEYPRFDGTKISRVETREYASASGTLVRVILYVDGAPNFESFKKGNNLVLELK